MASTVILGSGVVGLAAQKICDLHGIDATVIPYGRSRFYSYDVPLGDDAIECDPSIEDFMKAVFPHTIPLKEMNGFSLHGNIVYVSNPLTIDHYLTRVYDDCDQLKIDTFKLERWKYSEGAAALYSQLLLEYRTKMAENWEKYGTPVSINRHSKTIRTEKETTIHYDRLISTIPWKSFAPLVGYRTTNIESSPVFYYLLVTDKLDFEGNTSLFVVDEYIPFFKGTRVAPAEYLIQSREEVDPAFFQLMGGMVKNRTMIEDALPLGLAPDCHSLENNEIYQLGSLAQHDDFMCVGSCIKRCLRLVKS